MDCSEGPPVPIPNTEVKLTSAENTWVATPWEDRETPTQKAIIQKGNRFFAFFIQNFSKLILPLVFFDVVLYNI